MAFFYGAAAVQVWIEKEEEVPPFLLLNYIKLEKLNL